MALLINAFSYLPPKINPDYCGPMEHRLDVRVYYEDTDCIGVVYHASYLRFLERGRTEFLGRSGSSIAEWNRQGLVFAVYSISATFRAPGRLLDDLVVITRMAPASDYRARFEQRIVRKADDRLLLTAEVDVVCMDAEGKLKEFPGI